MAKYIPLPDSIKSNFHKIERYIEAQSGQPILEAFYLPQGLTNHNYLLMMDGGEKWVLRQPKEGNERLFNYRLEGEILTKIAPLDLEPKILYFDPESGIKVSEYQPDVSHFSATEEKIEGAAKMIKRLHEARLTIGETFNLVTEFNRYKSESDSKRALYDLSPYHSYLDAVESMSEGGILCHNDLVEGNFLFSEDRSFLIDYEYARDNDPYFDLMSFITENDLQNPHDRALFYEHYFGHQPTKEEAEKLAAFEAGHHILWCQWGMMMHQKHHLPIYKEIAELKYQRLQEFLLAQ